MTEILGDFFGPLFYNGMRVIIDEQMINIHEDWSKVRSPSRATRRRKQGHKQHITFIQIPKTEVYIVHDRDMIMHPETWRKLKAMTKEHQ